MNKDPLESYFDALKTASPDHGFDKLLLKSLQQRVRRRRRLELFLTTLLVLSLISLIVGVLLWFLPNLFADITSYLSMPTIDLTSSISLHAIPLNFLILALSSVVIFFIYMVQMNRREINMIREQILKLQ